MAGYTINGIISGQDEISELFGTSSEPETVENEGKDTPKQTEQEKETEEEVTEPTTIQDLFGEAEKVGDDEDTDIVEGEPSNNDGSSPNKLYSSIANSLAEDGALSNLSEEELKEVKDAESLVNAMKKQVDSMLDDRQKRIAEALDNGVDIPEIQKYENVISYLNGITDETLEAETPEAENLRKQIIYQYQIDLGVNESRANKEVERAFSSGTDIEDAKEYLESLKQTWQTRYKNLVDEKKQQMQAQKQAVEEATKRIRTNILENEKIMGDIVVDKVTRQKAFDNLMKPTFRTSDGKYQTALQKYIAENPEEFQTNVALLYTMTDGFKNMGGALKATVKKEKKKTLAELENVVNNTQRTPSGIINMKGDKDSSFRGLQFAPPDLWNK